MSARMIRDWWWMIVYGVLAAAALFMALWPIGVASAQDPAAAAPLLPSGGGWETVTAIALMAIAQGLAVLQAHLKHGGEARARKIETLEALVEKVRTAHDEEREKRVLAEVRLENAEAKCEGCRFRPDPGDT